MWIGRVFFQSFSYSVVYSEVWEPIYIVFLILSFITGMVIAGAMKLFPGFLPDVPNHRSSHSNVVPRGGGLGFIIPFTIFLPVLMFLNGELANHGLWSLLVGAILIAGVGLLDDAFALPAAPRLFFQIIVAVGVSLYVIPARLNLLGILDIQGWPALLLQVFWLLACINFYNFIDGIDGLAASQAIMIALGLGCILYLDFVRIQELSPAAEGLIGFQTFRILSLSCFCLAASVAGFLIWNLPPAGLFMGDTGSYFLGFIFGFIALYLPYTDSPSYVAPAFQFTFQLPGKLLTDHFSVLILMTSALLDPALTIVRRLLQKKNLFHAHRAHTYQLLLRSGWSAGKIDLLFIGLTMVMCLPLYWRISGGSTLSVSLLFLSLIGFFTLVFYIGAEKLTRKLNG